MTGIGEKIIGEIVMQGMFTPHEVDARGPVARPLIFVWRPNSGEQLEALVEQHIREMSAEDVMRIRWPENNIPE